VNEPRPVLEIDGAAFDDLDIACGGNTLRISSE
jgi:hypothetical protein